MAAYPKKLPPQHQDEQPGRQWQMNPQPESVGNYRAAGKLAGKKALITGGDSGIGRAIAILFAKEGADVAINYLDEQRDAQETQRLVEAEGRDCFLVPGNIQEASICKDLVQVSVEHLGGLHCLVNNAAMQFPQERLEDITPDQLQVTFSTNIFSMFYLTQTALPHLHEGDTIINTTSVTAYRGSEHLLDYSATKGAIVAFTRSLAQNLAHQQKGIRVNAVAPGPVWTPLIPATFPAEHVESFGKNVPLGRAGQPAEIATSYVFLASEDSSYMTGQVLHPNGGEMVES